MQYHAPKNHNIKLLTLASFLLISMLASACSNSPTDSSSDSPTSQIAAEATNERQTCPEPRAKVCTMIYQPVCAIKADGSTFTASSECSACGDESVVAYSDGECASHE